MDDPALIKAKAERARVLAGSQAFQEFVQDAETRAVEDWKAAQTLEARELAHALLLGVRQLEAVVNIAISAGDVLDYDEAKRGPITRPLA